MTAIVTRVLLVLLVVATIGCDRVTKRMAATTLAGTASRSFLGDTVRLEYAENPGGFLSLGATLPAAARTGVFTVATGVALIVMVGIAIRERAEGGWRLLGLTLYIAGALSNWFDRFSSGRVVDFLNIGVGPVRTGIFNVADVAIMLGACLLILPWIRTVRDHPS